MIGARIFPTEELNRQTGLDVDTWLREGLVDYVAPAVYSAFVLDANMPIDWLVNAAHEQDISVYGVLQPFCTNERRRFQALKHSTPAMIRAAAANFLELGTDGFYTWHLPWPLGAVERGILTELGHPDLMEELDKQYFLRRRAEGASFEYETFLPLEIPSHPVKGYQIPFSIADDPHNDRIHHVQLRMNVANVVSADTLEVFLNGRSLAGETCTRTLDGRIAPYREFWLEFELETVRPQRGRNILEISLKRRPPGLAGLITINDVEVIVEYSALTPPTVAGQEI